MTNSQGILGEVRSTIAPDGITIRYEVVGQGPPVAFLHGSFVGRSAFSRQRSALGKQFRLLLISSRGHDGTDGALPSHFGFASSEIEDVCAVLNAEEIVRTHLVGHSTGGATAVALAQHCPERIARMVLIEPTLYPLLPPPVYQQVSRVLLGITAAIESSDEPAAWRGMMEFAGGDKWLALDETKKAQTIDALTPFSPLLKPHAQHLLNFPISDEDVRKLQVPTLLFYGDDSLFFESALSTRLRSLRADFRQVHVKDSGHNVQRDQPDLVNAEILHFFSSSDGTPAAG